MPALVAVNADLAISRYHVALLETVHKRLAQDGSAGARRVWGVNLVMADGSVHFREAALNDQESARNLLATWRSAINEGA